jgi:holo-[acyl-carrier protein] synthase
MINHKKNAYCVISIGTDIIEIERIRSSLLRYKEKFLKRIFTPHEKAYCEKFKDPYPHFAVRFAGKEAIIKALSAVWQHPISWDHIEIQNLPQGMPQVFFLPPLDEYFSDFYMLITLSHCKMYATATALLCQKNPK